MLRARVQAFCLIMFVCALSEELRDDELIVSLDHCGSGGRHRCDGRMGASTRKATRRKTPTKRKGACDAIDARTGQANVGPIRSAGGTGGSLRNAAAHKAIRRTHILSQSQWPQYRRAARA